MQLHCFFLTEWNFLPYVSSFDVCLNSFNINSTICFDLFFFETESHVDQVVFKCYVTETSPEWNLLFCFYFPNTGITDLYHDSCNFCYCWDRTLLQSPAWPWTLGSPPASASWVLSHHACLHLNLYFLIQSACCPACRMCSFLLLGEIVP